jgi:hypothetical protein
MSDNTTPGATNTEPAAGGAEGTDPNAGAPASGSAAKGGEGKEGEGKAVVYEFEFPEGMSVNQAEVDEFKAAAAELNLDAEGAKKLVALRTKYAQQQADAFEQQVNGWADDAKADKEFGGDKFDENLGVAKKALDSLGTDALKELLKTSRMGNHPEVIRFFCRVGKAMSEDSFVRPGATTGANKSAADTIYGSNT